MNTSKQVNTQPTRFIPASKWHEYHPWPTQVGMRRLLFYREKNGFNKVIRKVGKTILINEASFFAWVEEHNTTKK